MNTHYAL